MAADRLSSAGMSVRPRYFASPLRALALLAAVFGLLFLASALAPVTLPASAVANVYTEEPPPPTPTDNGGGNGNGNGGTNTSDNDTPVSSDGSGGGSDSGSTGGGSGGSDSGSGSGNPSKQYSNGQYDPATDSDKEKAEQDARNGEPDETTISAAPASDDDGDGGSSLPLILAIIIGVPLIAGGGYLLWKRFRGSDDETREKLKSAVGGSAGGTGSSTGSGPSGS